MLSQNLVTGKSEAFAKHQEHNTGASLFQALAPHRALDRRITHLANVISPG